jgi:hypothetical protein
MFACSCCCLALHGCAADHLVCHRGSSVGRQAAERFANDQQPASERRHPRCGLQVFERFPGYQQAGALLSLAPNTQKALHAIDPALLAAAEATAVPDGRSIIYDHEGACAHQTWPAVPLAHRCAAATKSCADISLCGSNRLAQM